jgi:hypothetical protein
LVKVEENDDVASLYFGVLKSHRLQGIGRLMAKVGTDQAIRHRIRKIRLNLNAKVNVGATKILDSEDFQYDPDMPGVVTFTKELRWQGEGNERD